MIASVLKSEIEAFALRVLNHRIFELARRGQVPQEVATRYVASMRFALLNTGRHMALARRRSEQLARPEMAAYFAQKGREEHGHERWAEADLARMREHFGRESSHEPAHALAELMAYLDSAIEDDPARYMAYILFAEYLTVLAGPAWVSVLNEHCGVPATAMTCITEHVELDRDHVDDGLSTFDEIVSDPATFPKMRDSLARAMQYQLQFCDELYDLARAASLRYKSAS